MRSKPQRLLAGLCTVALPALAQVGLPGGSPLPLPGMSAPSPVGVPWGAPPVNPFLPANPFGAAPLAAGAPWLGGLAYPGLQLAPNWLSHQHLQYMTNPYLGGPAAGNPYLQPTLPLPFAPPAFSPSLPMLGQAGPRAPAGLPFAPLRPTNAQPANPYLVPAPGPAFPLDPAGWLGQMARPSGR